MAENLESEKINGGHTVYRALHNAVVIPYIKVISERFGCVGIDTSRQRLKEELLL
jgi:hypothetical protein